MTGSPGSAEAALRTPATPDGKDSRVGLSPGSSVFAWSTERQDPNRQDPWPWSLAETDSHSEGFQSEPEETEGPQDASPGLWHRLCALQHGLSEVERKISKHTSLQEARQQRCTRNRHRWVLQQRVQVPMRFRSLLPPGVVIASPEVAPARPAPGLPPRPVPRLRASGARRFAPRPRRAAVRQEEPLQPAFCLEEQVPKHREAPIRFRFPSDPPPLSPSHRSPVTPEEEVTPAVLEDDVPEGSEDIQKEEDMLRELQILSNSFQPDTGSSSSRETGRRESISEKSGIPVRHSYLQHPSDPGYSRNLSTLSAERRESVDSSHPSEGKASNSHRSVQSDPPDAAPNRRFSSSNASQVSDLPRPRHAVIQDPVAAMARLSEIAAKTKGNSAPDAPSEAPRSHRHAVYDDPATLGVLDALQKTEEGQESSESHGDDGDAAVQQILKDFKDNASSHAPFENVDSLEGLEHHESEDSEEDSEEDEDDDEDEESEESEGADDAHLTHLDME